MKLRVQLKVGYQDWNVNAECRRVVKPIAKIFGVSVEEFLRLYSRYELPNQPKRNVRSASLRRQPRRPAAFRLTLGSRVLEKRLTRAAKFSRLAPDTFVWNAVLSQIECCEEDMICHPTSGEPIGDDMLLSGMYSFLGDSLRDGKLLKK